MLVRADEAVADVNDKSMALSDSIDMFGEVTSALAVLEADIGKSRGLADAETVAITHRESTKLATK